MRAVYLRLAWLAAFGRDALLIAARVAAGPFLALSNVLDRAALYWESKVRRWS
jgi:hypothetical protein